MTISYQKDAHKCKNSHISTRLFLMTYTEHHKEHMDQSPGHLSSGADAQTDHCVEDASGEGSQRNPLQPRSHPCVDCRLDSRIDEQVISRSLHGCGRRLPQSPWGKKGGIDHGRVTETVWQAAHFDAEAPRCRENAEKPRPKSLYWTLSGIALCHAKSQRLFLLASLRLCVRFLIADKAYYSSANLSVSASLRQTVYPSPRGLAFASTRTTPRQSNNAQTGGSTATAKSLPGAATVHSTPSTAPSTARPR